MRKICFQLVLVIIGGLWACGVARAQDGHPVTNSKDHFPYTFENFVWWSDAELRSLLKRQLPTLGEEIERGSPIQSRVRSALTQLLREKGIQAEVLSIEPSMGVFFDERDPEAPPASIVYSVISPPEILVDKLTYENAPEDAAGTLKEVAASMETKPYQRTNFWWERQRIKQGLQQLGYLSSEVKLDGGTPRKVGERYVVPVKATITPGPKYHVASMNANGGPLVQGRDLSPYFAAKPGDVATPNVFGRLPGALRSTYWHAGYADVQISGSPVLDTAHALASYQLQVTPGPLYHLRSLKFENLDPAQETKARELLGLKTGDVYDQLALAAFQRKLAEGSSPLRGYGFSYSPKEDKQKQAVDLTLIFEKQ